MDYNTMLDNYQREQENWLKRRPVCSSCGEHIQAPTALEYNGLLFCEYCEDAFLEAVASDCRVTIGEGGEIC